MVDAGITKVGVITKSNYRSLMDHLGTGKPWDLSRKREGMTLLPPFNTPESGMFRGKLDALTAALIISAAPIRNSSCSPTATSSAR